ncbi:tryptophan-rich protein [Methyloglobulus morosus KoM1]|uniref:Tryptophan-rich protein n=1 Tax=Methyloglobulus morosus KoM1 TaxID=1116472 RepID=V5E2X3_9GAMM|nr:TIGR02450 family Trp-rich protein [Methyloglobulus morosus]ESS73906.1 tryptophan-rich protein [Methyloglobulus morosus KoM1]
MKALNKPTGNRINPAKLLLSKWTAVTPQDKEKHFLVTRTSEDGQGVVIIPIPINSRIIPSPEGEGQDEGNSNKNLLGLVSLASSKQCLRITNMKWFGKN